MHPNKYKNQIENNLRFRNLYEQDYTKRLQFARDNGCNTIILTGDGEPLMNRTFLTNFAHWNKVIEKPFRWIEIQTSGINLDDEYLRYLRNTVGVTTISLSLSNIFSNKINAEINQTPKKLKVDIEKVCSEIKRYDFNLRLSLNMTSEYNKYKVREIFERARKLGANQITFRKLYVSKSNCTQNKWIKKYGLKNKYFEKLNRYITKNGRALEVLPFGAIRYSLNEMSVVVDDDCMNTEVKDKTKYLILRPNCKLYTKWDDKGSLLF
jgi:sulfatase maturation enzyme AslB (radical SAM superfamily)